MSDSHATPGLASTKVIFQVSPLFSLLAIWTSDVVKAPSTRITNKPLVEFFTITSPAPGGSLLPLPPAVIAGSI